jgi:hypothetical protein
LSNEFYITISIKFIKGIVIEGSEKWSQKYAPQTRAGPYVGGPWLVTRAQAKIHHAASTLLPSLFIHIVIDQLPKVSLID